MINPGSGDFPVGQFEAQNLFPNGRGIPSFASSVMKGWVRMHCDVASDEPWFTREAAKVYR